MSRKIAKPHKNKTCFRDKKAPTSGGSDAITDPDHVLRHPQISGSTSSPSGNTRKKKKKKKRNGEMERRKADATRPRCVLSLTDQESQQSHVQDKALLMTPSLVDP